MSSEFERTGDEVVHEGAIFTVREETFRHEDGEESTREIVRHTGAVGVVCHDGESLWLVRQPREAVGEPDLLELPAGKLDVEGESALQTAKRELAEEIGRAAEHWEAILSYHSSIGYSDECVHLFAATGLSDADVEADPGERIEIVAWPRSDLAGALAETTDAKTLLGLGWLRERR